MVVDLNEFAETFLSTRFGVAITRGETPSVVLLTRPSRHEEWQVLRVYESWQAIDCINASAMLAKCGVALYAREEKQPRFV